MTIFDTRTSAIPEFLFLMGKLAPPPISLMRENVNKSSPQNRFKINMGYVYSIVWGVSKCFFSQDILDKDRIPAGSCEENNGLIYSVLLR